MNGHVQRGISRRATRCSLCALLVAAAAHLHAAQGATRLVPEEHANIQAAIDASATGDTVLIGPGIFRGEGNREIELRGRDIVVKSRTGPEDTIIDCEYAGRGFYLDEWETRAARIEGLTITRGATQQGDPGAAMGGGIFCGLASPMILNCRIYECYSTTDGGGLGFIVFEGIVDQCVVSGCWAERGGGIWVEMGESEIKNCVVTGNHALTGGGICFGGTGPNRLFGSTVAANVAGHNGGGIYAPNPLLLDRCIVWDNCTSGLGPEILCGNADIRCSDIDVTGVDSGGTVLYDENCVFTNPLFCRPAECGLSTEGDWQLDAASPCLPEHSLCGELIGALGQGCGSSDPAGACCALDGTCTVLSEQECADQQGAYMGDDVPCVPDLCHATPVEPSTWGRIKAAYREAR